MFKDKREYGYEYGQKVTEVCYIRTTDVIKDFDRKNSEYEKSYTSEICHKWGDRY